MTQNASDGLTDYRLLGRSGLKVAPLTLGAMGFGWWLDRETSLRIFTRYFEAGGNVGASMGLQLESNLHALDFTIPAELGSELERLSAPDETELAPFFGPILQGMVNGGTRVRRLHG
jgi:aryl-alcohol dehydrogenase-like predicted oxidoreductase